MSARLARAYRLLAACLCLILLLGSVPSPSTNAAADDPRVLGISPAGERLVGAQTAIAVTFSQPMDRLTTEAAFRLEPTTPGRFNWAAGAAGTETLLFNPSSGYVRSSLYTITIGLARDKASRPLQNPLSRRFRTLASTTLVRSNPPASATDIPLDAQISLTFDQPVIPLTAISNQPDVRGKVMIDPPLAGRFRWLGTTNLTFEPSERLRGDTTYRVNIRRDLDDATGSPLAQDYSFSFTTEPPRLLHSFPSLEEENNLVNNYGSSVKFDLPEQPPLILGINSTLNSRNRTEFRTVGPATPILAHFSQPMDHARIEAAFSITPTVAGNFSWGAGASGSEVMTYTPASPLALNTRYTATITSTAGLAIGNTPAREVSWSFHTLTPPEIFYQDTEFVGSRSTNANRNLRVFFNNPIKVESLRDAIKIDPAAPFTVTLPTSGTVGSIVLEAKFEYSITYTVSLARDLEDAVGQKLAARRLEVFRVEPPQPVNQQPRIELVGVGDRASFNAAQPTGLYVGSVNGTVLRYNIYGLDREQSVARFGGYDGGRGMTAFSTQLVPRSAQSNFDDTRGLTVLRTWTQTIDAPLNQWRSTPLNLALTAGADRLPPGRYLFSAELDRSGLRVQPSDDRIIYDSLLLVVARNSLTLKIAPDETLIWAVDQASSQPSANLPITIYQLAEGRVVTLTTGTTDRDGIYRAKIADRNNDNRILAMAGGNDAAIVSRNWQNYNPNSRNTFEDRVPLSHYSQSDNAFNVYLYTERPLYRPGQTVYGKVILRRNDDATFTIPTRVTGTIRLMVDGQALETVPLTLSPQGTWDGAFTLKPDAKLGRYYLRLSLYNPLPNNPDFEQAYDTLFAVEEYRKPEFEVMVAGQQPAYLDRETLRANLKVDYFSGGAATDPKLTARIYASDYYFSWRNPDGDGDYFFGEGDPWYRYYYDYYGGFGPRFNGERLVAEKGSFERGSDGTLVVTQTLNLEGRPSQRYRVQADVQDNTNQSSTASGSVIVHQANVYVGVRTSAYLAAVGQPLTVSVQTVSPAGQRLGNRQVAVGIYTRTYEYVPFRGDRELSTPLNEYPERDTLVQTTTLTTDARGRASLRYIPLAEGQYVLKAISSDEAGRLARTISTLYVSPAPSRPRPPAQPPATKFEMIADKPIYNVGDRARILVTSPYPAATALLTTERLGIRSAQVVRLGSGNNVLEVPLDAGSLPNIYVGLTLVGSEDGNPAFAQGSLELLVATTSRELSVSLTPSKAQYQPGEVATYTVRTTNRAGQPVAANLSFALVDKAIYTLADDTTADILLNYYAPRGLRVSTINSLANQRTQGAAYAEEAATRSAEVQEAIVAEERGLPMTGGDIGGRGGGGGEDTFEPPDVRSELLDTACLRANVQTDARGLATIRCKLPDNATTWRAVARAVSADTLVGAATQDLLVTKPLLVRSLLPRFMTTGDKLTPAVIVRNTTTAAQEVTVTLQLTGTGFAPGTAGVVTTNGVQTASRRVTVAGNNEVKVEWPVQAGNAGLAGFTLAAQTRSGLRDGLRIVLPVVPILSPEVVADAGEVGDSLSRSIFVPYGVDPNGGELRVTLNASLAGAAIEGANYTLGYGYECTEQTTSRFLPLLAINAVYRDAGRVNPDLARLDPVITRSIERLYQLQQSNGGWGVWEERDHSEVNPFLTAYAIEGLLAARAQGYTTGDGRIASGVAYLQRVISTEAGRAADPNPNVAVRTSVNTRAYVLYVLGLAGVDNVAALRELSKAAPASFSIFGRAHFVLALARAGQTDLARQMLAPLTAAARQTSDTVHWEENRSDPFYYYLMDDDDRATALAMRAILTVNPSDDLARRAVRWLMQHRREASHWRSTQSTAHVVVALAEFVRVKKELAADYGYGVALNGQAAGAGSYGPTNLTTTQRLNLPLASLPFNQESELRISRDRQNGQLYYGLSLRYLLPGENLTAANYGLGISRSYYTATTTMVGDTPLNSVAAGGLVRVRLSLVVTQTSYYVLIEDPLPAGLEAVNPYLKNSATYGEAGCGINDYCRAYDGVQLRDDRVAFFASYLSPGTYQFEYIARATTPGDFFAQPTQAYLLYDPDVFGRGDGLRFAVGK